MAFGLHASVCEGVSAGVPASTSMVISADEDWRAEFVAVKAMTCFPCCDAYGTQLNRPLSGSKEAPAGRPAAAS